MARLAAELPNLTIVDAVDGAALGRAELRELAASGFLPLTPLTRKSVDAYVAGHVTCAGA